MLSKKTPAVRAAYGGVFTALTVIFLYLSSVFANTFDVVFYILASVMIGVCIKETGIKFSIAVYVATCIVSFMIIPNLFVSFTFCLFFGIVPILYYLVDIKFYHYIKIVVILIFDILYTILIYVLISKFYGEYFNDVKYPFAFLLLFLILYYPAYQRTVRNIYYIIKRRKIL